MVGVKGFKHRGHGGSQGNVHVDLFEALRSMKKKSSKGPAAKDVDHYLADVAEPARGTLNKVRAAIRAAVPKSATEYLSYGIPTFGYEGHLVAFAAFKKHCSFFPMSYAVIDAFTEELGDFTISKGTIRFPLDKPLPAAVLKRMVKARVAENKGRK